MADGVSVGSPESESVNADGESETGEQRNYALCTVKKRVFSQELIKPIQNVEEDKIMFHILL